MTQKKDILDPQDVKTLVNTFYQKVLKDDQIGFFFNDVVKLDLESHLPVMHSLWENVLFYSGKYKGNPMTKHVAMNKIAPLKQVHFDQWLMLWTKTVNDLFEGPKAQEAVEKANQIAKLMLFNINQS